MNEPEKETQFDIKLSLSEITILLDSLVFFTKYIGTDEGIKKQSLGLYFKLEAIRRNMDDINPGFPLL